jgi:glycerophosphoryl diester phosphodiesterase
MTTITGHRGARGLWPENSRAGFRGVLGLDVDGIEFDVHLTASGELLVIHDRRLDRTTTGDGLVGALTPDVRAAVRLRDTDETIPTLDEVLEIFAEDPRKQLYVELKTTAAPIAAFVEQVVARLDDHGLRARCHLTSFDLAVLSECWRRVPDLSRLVSVDTARAERAGGLPRLVAQAAELVELVAVEHRLLAEQWDVIRSLLSLDRLCVWTVNDPGEISSWLGRDIGQLTTDRPDLALAVRAGRTSP